jgi:hypothetical protein
VREGRWILTLILVAAVASCADGVAPGALDGVRIVFSLQAPAAVSQQETEVLGSAFDRVDSYEVVVTDSINGTPILTDTLDVVEAGADAHDLSVAMPESTVGLAVLVSVVGRDGGVELYRTASYMRVEATRNPTPVPLPLRYTGPGLRGVVMDANGAGIADVAVELFQGQTLYASVTTEPDGTYLFLPPSEGGILNPGQYLVRPFPPGEFVCPALRSVSVTTSTSLVANFTAQDALCQVDLLIVSGGDVDDTETVEALFTQTPNVESETFFYVNQTPGLSYLSQFDVVLLFANGQFNESATLGSEIGSYVQAGGNVVFASFYWQNRSDSNLGSPGWGTLESVDPFESSIDSTAGVGGATYQAAVLGQVMTGDAATGDALVLGLDVLASTGFRGGVAVASGATVVAEWSDGQPLIGYRILPGGQRLVAVSLFPASGTAATGDVQALWENAVRWAGEAGGPQP